MDNRLFFIIFIVLLIMAGIIYTTEEYLPFWRCPLQVRKNINQSNANISEILKVTEHYQTAGEAEKLQALYFLLENMSGHLYADVCIQNEQGKQLEYDSSFYANLEEAQQALEALEQEYGEVSWHLKKAWFDQETMTAELLIENIEEAFDAWHFLPWSRNYDLYTFLNYILPYRGSSEPLESFRPYFRAQYSNLSEISDPVLAAAEINESLKSVFGFNPKYYLHPTDQGLAEMLASGEGRCEDMTNLAIYALRANGIAVTSDYTPYWADSGNNHAWNAVLTPAGEAIPFMGCESNPGDYGLRQRIAKVYRKMFSEQASSLGSQLQVNEKAPGWLRGKSYIDVTDSYVPTANIAVVVDSLPTSPPRFLYLAVFNDGNWEAIAWSQLENGKAEFKNIGIDLVYLPVYYIDDKLIAAGEAFLLNSNGGKEELRVTESFQNMDLRSTTRMKISNLTGENDITNLKSGKEYELYYWQKGWQIVANDTFKAEKLHFMQVPENGLYWLREKDSDKEERIFIYRDQQQIWY
ncbi:MAG: transglutaminase-like domain-containing protein [Candidatus Cloacimonetes bacterium]|nr:transglutaminase-like domain-containing protein [Candidatus Cloacimonadota bacterium]